MSKYKSVIQNFEKLNSNLIESLSGLMHFHSDSSVSYREMQKEKQDLVESLEKGDISIEDDSDETIIFESVRGLKARVDGYSGIINILSVIYAIAHFEAFLTDTLKEMLRLFPASLKTSKKQLTYEEIFSHADEGKLLETILEKEVIEFSFLSVAEQVRFFQKRFNITLLAESKNENKEELNLDRLIELFSARNIILHNNSIVNRKYLKDNPHTKLKLDEIISFQWSDTQNTIMFLIYVARLITENCVKKIDNKAN